eukprot:2005068-Prymnesium_polylepis.1
MSRLPTGSNSVWIAAHARAAVCSDGPATDRDVQFFLPIVDVRFHIIEPSHRTSHLSSQENTHDAKTHHPGKDPLTYTLT